MNASPEEPVSSSPPESSSRGWVALDSFPTEIQQAFLFGQPSMLGRFFPVQDLSRFTLMVLLFYLMVYSLFAVMMGQVGGVRVRHSIQSFSQPSWADVSGSAWFGLIFLGVLLLCLLTHYLTCVSQLGHGLIEKRRRKQGIHGFGVLLTDTDLWLRLPGKHWVGGSCLHLAKQEIVNVSYYRTGPKSERPHLIQIRVAGPGEEQPRTYSLQTLWQGRTKKDMVDLITDWVSSHEPFSEGEVSPRLFEGSAGKGHPPVLRFLFPVLALGVVSLVGLLTPAKPLSDQERFEHRSLHWGRLRIESNQLGAIYLNGEKRDFTPHEMKLEAGRYDVEVRFPGYTTWSTTLEIQDGEELLLKAELRKLPPGTSSH